LGFGLLEALASWLAGLLPGRLTACLAGLASLAEEDGWRLAGWLAGSLAGQLAVVTGKKDVAAAAKVLKTYQSEFEKPKLQFGYVGSKALKAEELRALADLPPLEQLQAKILGLLQAPATKLAVLINTPGSQLARVIKAKSEQG
jgi:large subunit ribosomal protein L10